jgi:pyruvate dehydrogenase E2 component (dihydrolipoamide acetyltransferase)
MPALGADIETAKLIEWKVKPGDRVKKGDIVAVIETTKSALDVESWQEGTVDQILVDPGEAEIPVGTLLAVLRTEEGETIPPMKSVPETSPQAQKPVAPPAASLGGAETQKSQRALSPAARKRVQEFHLDPSRIQGTGPHGVVTLEDVEKAIAAQTPSPAPEQVPEADKKLRMRQAIAAAMDRSHREIPHYYLETQIHLDRALQWMETENKQKPPEKRLLPLVLFLKAVALGLKKFPEFNGFYTDGAFQPSEAVHVGVAVSMREGGLMAPALHDADKKNLHDLMHELADLIQRVRRGGLKSSEITDPTVTVTSLGDEGVEKVFGIIYPPQVALVGFGKIFEGPVAEAGRIVPRRVVIATLSADHRVSDGHRGGIFLSTVGRLLQEPEKL